MCAAVFLLILSTLLDAQASPNADSVAAQVKLIFDGFMSDGQNSSNLNAAQTYAAMVDSLRLAPRTTRIEMHRRLASGFMLFSSADDTLRMRTEDAEDRFTLIEAERMRRVIAEPPAPLDQASYDAEEWAWERIERSMQFLFPDSLPIIAARADAALSRYDATVGKHDRKHWEDMPGATWARLMMAERQAYHNWHPPFYRLRGVWPAPRLHADYWIPPPGRPASDTVRPVPGKVNLICTAGDPTNAPGHPYSQAILAAYIRNWWEKYGAQNLEVTLVWPTSAHVSMTYPSFDNTALHVPSPTAVLHFPSPVEEAGWYIQGYEELPVAIAVQGPHLSRIVTPDKQAVTIERLQVNDFWAHDPEVLWRMQDANERDPGTGTLNNSLLRPGEMPGQCALIGRDGTIEHTGIQTDYWVNTRWAVRLLFEGAGAPPR